MGYIRHRLLIGETPVLSEPRAEWMAKFTTWRASLPENWQRLIISPVDGIVNHNQWIVFLPDASKEGWPESDQGDKYARQFCALFEEDSQPIQLTFGDDGPAAREGMEEDNG